MRIHSFSDPGPMTDNRVSRSRRSNQVDIAEAANVSTATVSRVVNGSPMVRPEVRERVVRAMDRLGYFPNGVAQALARNKSWTIGAVVPTLENDLFARGIDALIKRLRRGDYSLMVVSSDYSLDSEAIEVKRLLERGVDGLLLVGQQRNPETARLLQRSGRPYVEAYSSDASTRDNFIGFNNAAAAASLVDHLHDLGHRRFGMLSGITAGNDRAAMRLVGVRERLAHHGLALEPDLVREMPFEIDAAREGFRYMLNLPRRPTALICANDLIAMGALIEATVSDFPIPRQMSVAGIDNHPLSRHACPPLTTVDIPAGRIGEIAAEALIDAIEHGTPIGKHSLEAPLLVRQSTAPPPGEIANGVET